MARVKEPVSREAGLFFSNPVIHKEPMGHIIKSNNIILFGLTLCLVFGSVCLYPPLTLWAQDEAPLPESAVVPVPEEPAVPETDSLVIVLDPGHGGDEEGGLYENFIEKDMNLILANAMKEELEKYEGVTVYLTRTGDQKLSLAERSAFAKSVNADFMFCLHFNLSREHTLFGAECWVSAFGEEHSKGYSFASVEMQMLQELGLYSRGIKTRLNKDGIDYYGIIRTASELDVPCVLIEHCHMDHMNDRSFCEGREQWETFGRLDATAAAKYFNLKSDVLGVDYSNYQNLEVPVPAHTVRPDSTPPDVCLIDLVSQDMETGEVTVQISAADYDSGMFYYTYSYDGGETFSGLQPWGDKSQDTITFTMQVPPHIIPQIVVNGYNGYDLITESNLLSLPSMDYKTEEELAAEKEKEEAVETAAETMEPGTNQETAPDKNSGTDNQPAGKDKEETNPGNSGRTSHSADSQQAQQSISLEYFLTVCLVCALLVLGMALSMILLVRSRKKRRRRRR